jgi:capsular polysaccharide biosynthesis protein
MTDLPEKGRVTAAAATPAVIEIVNSMSGPAGSAAAAWDPTNPQMTIRLGNSDSPGEIRLFDYESEHLRLKRDRVSALELRFGAPAIQRYEGLLYVPGHDCLFDESGQPVVETQEFSRVTAGHQIVSKSRTGLSPMPQVASRVDFPILFSGWAQQHWGKFLTRGISRLWALSEFDPRPEVKLLRAKWSRYRDTFLPHAGIEADRFVKITEPTRLDEVLVPEPSFVERWRLFDCHFVLPERVAESVCGPSTKLRDEPVYLSRSRLPTRRHRSTGEKALEEVLARTGIRVVWPETMSYEDQVRLFNEHSTYIGQLGSAFHTLIYRLPGRPARTIAFDPLRPHWESFAMIDLLKGVQANYVRTKPMEAQAQSGRTDEADGAVDVAASVGWLKSLSVI